ncbi:MAG: hypothetical protein GC155_07245 [Alphaproteobacteria bacterium]|nr:hypothetical protein [Alphaproteobacteria bacterium]
MSRTWSDEQLSAMLDGELPEQEARALRLDLSIDADLTARLDRLRVANEAFVASATVMDNRPMPPELARLLAGPSGTNNVVPFRRRIGAAIVEHRAIAASLLCVAALGGLVSLRTPSQTPAAGDDTQLIASASPLGRVLDTGISAVPVSLPSSVTATPRLSFQRADGRFCRQYRLNEPGQTTDGIACRDPDGWRTELLVFGPAAPATTDYQSASGPAPDLLGTYVDQQMKGAPLNAADETKAIANRWRNK